MNETDKRRLRSILRKIDSLRNEVEDLLGAEPIKGQNKSETSEGAKQLLKSIKNLTLSELETQLDALGHKELGDVFVGVGGSSGDKRKPKAWLNERIIWLSKEFFEAHKSIRES